MNEWTIITKGKQDKAETKRQSIDSARQGKDKKTKKLATVITVGYTHPQKFIPSKI